MAKDYPWYKIVEGDECLNQGDFVNECPIIIPPSEMQEGEECDVRILNYNVIIMSQSCDLENKKIDLVLLCPV